MHDIERKRNNTLLDHLLDRARMVDLHRKEVVEAIDLGRLLGELLAKRI